MPSASAAFQRAARTLGSDLNGAVDYDASMIGVRVYTPGFEAALSLLADLALHPDFDQRVIDPVRTSMLADLAQREDHPRAVLADTMASSLYPAEHPYRTPILGTKAALEGISRSDLRAFYRSFFTASHVTIVAAGDITRSALTVALEERFGAGAFSSAAPEAERPLPAVNTAAPGPRLVVVDDPGSVQSYLALGGIGAPRRAADHLSIVVLGRLLSSALWANLRQRKGYSYGASAAFSARREAGPFVAGSEVAREETAQAATELFAELQRLREKEVSPARLDEIRRLLLNETASAFQTTDATAAALLDLATHHLPVDEYATLRTRLEALTPAELLRVARARLDPEQIRLFVVGDASVIGSGLARLGLGAPEMRSLHRRSGGGAEEASDTGSFRQE